MPFENRILSGSIEETESGLFVKLLETKVFKNIDKKGDEPICLHFKNAALDEKLMTDAGLSANSTIEAETAVVISENGISLKVVSIITQPTSP